MTCQSQAQEIIKEIKQLEQDWKVPQDDKKWSYRNTRYFEIKAKASGLLTAWKDWLNDMEGVKFCHPDDDTSRLDSTIEDLTSAIKILEDGGIKI